MDDHIHECHRKQVAAGQYGSDLSATYGFDAYGYPASTVTGSLQSYSYNFNTVTGNLKWRQNNKYSGLKDSVNYDNLDRIDNVYKGTGTPVLTLDMAYDGNKGGITTKSDAGTMFYNTSGKPYRLSGISPTTGLVPSNTQSITYTSFESVSTIGENNYVASFTYNPEAQRAKMVVQQSGNTILTRWYSGSTYIKETAGGVTKQYTFIGGDAYTAPVVAIKTGTGTPVYYYLLRDYLGSITHVVNTSKTTVAEYSYDAWGRMRNPTNWTNYAPGTEPALFVAGRGFTGHEHMPWFNSINMNGRIYDPLIGQFLSPDNYVQSPDFTQNLNRYSYCLNNPLKYSDPSGEYIFGILATIFCPPLIPVGMAIDAGIGFAVDYSNAKSRGLSTGQSLLYAGTNLGISMLSQNINIKGIIPNGSLHAIMGVAGNGISNLTIKEPFFENWGPSAISGGLSGGLSGYQLAKEGGLNYWWGNNIAYNRNSWSFFNVDKPDFVIGMGIPNVGSLAENDCYPTTFSEIEAKKGGSRSYQDFAKNANYSEGKGLIINRSDYRNLMNTTFGTVDILNGNAANQVFDPSFMRMASQNGEIISFHFSGSRPHADNVRQLRVFLNAPMKNRLMFRQSSYNFSQYSGWNNIWSIFRIY